MLEIILTCIQIVMSAAQIIILLYIIKHNED